MGSPFRRCTTDLGALSKLTSPESNKVILCLSNKINNFLSLLFNLVGLSLINDLIY